MDIVLVKKYLRENLGFSDKKIQKIHKYIDLLLIFNKKYNLISKSTEKEVWNRHILDSAQIIKYIDFEKDHILSDFGSGAGLPGVILSIANTNPNFHVKLYEKSPVKRQFLLRVVKELKLNAEVLGDIQYHVLDTDIIICRAFKKLDRIIQVSREIAKKPHKLIILKGQNAQEELNKSFKTKKYPYKLENSITNNKSKIILMDVK